MSKLKKIVWMLAVVALLMIIGAGVSIKMLTNSVDVMAESTEFEVTKGDNLTRVAHRLASAGVVQHPSMLLTFAKVMGKTNIKRGEYRLGDEVSDLELLQTLLDGAVISREITFIEGTTFKEALNVLANQEHLVKELSGITPEQIARLLGLGDQNPEGWLFPDTYQFSKETSDLDVLKTSVSRMKRVLSEEWQERSEDLPYKTPYEALIMASIVEKETGAVHERPEIAGVFVRRLRKNMRLQTDPTVIYGLGDSYKGNLRRRHLRQPTPYNTYVIKGLPPTPIALAGRAAIRAALHPQQGDALFFVAKGDGTHYFSRTLREHEDAVRQYQLNRQSNYRSAPPPP